MRIKYKYNKYILAVEYMGQVGLLLIHQYNRINIIVSIY